MRISLLIFATLVVCIAAAKNTTVTKLYPASKNGKAGENREKKSLYNFGNFGYSHQSLGRNNQHAQRRIANYNSGFYQQDPYPGQFNGPPNSYVPDANNHLVDHHPPYYQPEYAEPPEPIIEIIIKESNETLPEPPSQPYFIKKKKKEQVQVFYVNYKKGHNNKLQLEHPIPALTPAGFNNDHQEEEEEEVIHPVTPLPKLKTTTIRTIIHPESEKFHSNSGIHVSFNVEDKHQSGHQLQEDNEGSEIRSVVALPNPQVASNHHSDYQSHGSQLQSHGSQHQTHGSQHQTHGSQHHHQNYQNNHEIQNRQQHSHPSNHRTHQTGFTQQSYQTLTSPLPQSQQFNHRFQSNYRGDYSRAQQSFNSNYRTQSFQSRPTHLHPLTNHFQQPQQSSASQNLYSSFSSQSDLRPNGHRNQQQVTHLTPRSPPFIPQQQTAPQFQLPHHNAPQFNRPPPPHSPQHGPTQSLQPRPQIQFPNDPLKTNIKSHVNYQPLKQPQPSAQHRPIPIPLHSITPESQQQSFNRPLSFGPPQQGPPQHFAPEARPDTHLESNAPHFRPRPIQQFQTVGADLAVEGRPQSIHSPQPQPSHHPQSQHVQAPQQQFSHQSEQESNPNDDIGPVPFPHIQQNKFFPAGPPQHEFNHNSFGHQQQEQQHQQQQHQQQQHQQQQHQQHLQNQHQQRQQQQNYEQQQQQHKQQQTYEQQQHQQQEQHLQEGALQNINVPFLGNVKSELVKSVPRFEQHITETVGGGPVSAFGHNFAASQQQSYNEFTSQNNQDNAIQTVPSPNLGPTTPSSQLHHHPSTPAGGFSSTLSHHLNNYSTRQQHSFGGVTALSSPFPGVSSTASPLFTSDHQDRLQIVTPVPSANNNYNHHQALTGFDHNKVQPQIIPNSQPLPHKLPPPGQSVSTIHTEALKEIERLKKNYLAQRQQQEQLGNTFNQYNHQQTGPGSNHQPNGAGSNQESNYQSNGQSNYYQNPQQLVQLSGRNQYSSQISSTTFAHNHRYQTGVSSTTPSTTTTTTTEEPTTTTGKPKSNPNIVLPDEVPEDLRQQLLTSGILDNADISVLDYDKLGDTALENLPPEHLAHFYGAGGGSQISSSNKVLSVVKPNGEKVNVHEKQRSKTTKLQSLPKRENLDLKVVRFDSTNQKSITDKYIRPDATILPAVDINNPKYNRYLPLKINGAQFPIPDAQELRGKRVSSVVVLAPVDPLQEVDESAGGFESRQERGLAESKRIKFIAGDTLKTLLKKPTKENFKRWLEKESRTDIDFQSVVLLVAKNNDGEQEIFMYDIATKEINKLSGALSSAFVNVAEENASSQDIDNASISDSGIVERMSPERKNDIQAQASNRHETVVKFSSKIQSRRDDEQSPVYINSGYSVIRK